MSDALIGSAIEYGVTVVKVAILANGGGAIALLAFLGTLSANGLDPSAAMGFATALVWFGGGVLVGGLGAAMAYITQLWYIETINVKGKVNLKSRMRKVFEYSTAALFVLPFVCFGAGLCYASEAILLPYSSSSPDSAAAFSIGMPPPTML